jgi:hypothetical protein
VRLPAPPKPFITSIKEKCDECREGTVLRSKKDEVDRRASLEVATLNLVPHILWIGLAAYALWVFHLPLLQLFEERRVSKVAIGIFELDFAQQAVASIKDTPNIKEVRGIPKTWSEFKPIADRAERINDYLRGAIVLWVDDKDPSQNVAERRALEAFGIHFDLAPSSEEAFKWLDRAHYDAVISNIAREGEVSNHEPCFEQPIPAGAGCAMAREMHNRYGDKMPPLIFYSWRFPQNVGTPAYALGLTNRVDDLFHLVFDALERRSIDKTTNEPDREDRRSPSQRTTNEPDREDQRGPSQRTTNEPDREDRLSPAQRP